MTDHDFVETPNSQTEQSSEAISTSQVAKRCLESVEGYRKSERTSSDKASATRELVAALATSAPELSESESNNSLGTYLSMLEQHDRAIADAHARPNSEDSEAEEISPHRTKRAASPGSPDGTGKKQKQDDAGFPWVIREQYSDFRLEGDLDKTLKLLKLFAKDLKFAKSSVINSSRAPPFPHSEWTNIIAGSMVDLDHVISGSFAVSNDNREVERLGGMEVKFGITKPVKQVRTSGEWFIAWGSYTKAAVYVFPHRKEEFDSYGTRILSLFSATSSGSHSAIINLDKSI
jgi:hypothetical protein